MPIDPAEKERRRALLRAHCKAENEHDLDAIMKTFASGRASMLYNRTGWTDPEGIRAAHAYLGMSASPGAFENVRTVIDAEHFTEDEIVVEGRLCGRHVGDFLGFEATQRQVELPYVTFYRFDADGKLASERVVMNLGVLASNVGAQRSVVVSLKGAPA